MALHPTRVFSLTPAELCRALSQSLNEKALLLQTSKLQEHLGIGKIFSPLQENCLNIGSDNTPKAQRMCTYSEVTLTFLNETLSCYSLCRIGPSAPGIFQTTFSSRRMILFILFLLRRVAQPQTFSSELSNYFTTTRQQFPSTGMKHVFN